MQTSFLADSKTQSPLVLQHVGIRIAPTEKQDNKCGVWGFWCLFGFFPNEWQQP